MAEHSNGNMDIRGHEKTFSGFITFVKRTLVVIVVILVFLALTNS
jgi:hypothetical protein